jgi:hypothetical protein
MKSTDHTWLGAGVTTSGWRSRYGILKNIAISRTASTAIQTLNEPNSPGTGETFLEKRIFRWEMISSDWIPVVVLEASTPLSE